MLENIRSSCFSRDAWKYHTFDWPDCPAHKRTANHHTHIPFHISQLCGRIRWRVASLSLITSLAADIRASIKDISLHVELNISNYSSLSISHHLQLTYNHFQLPPQPYFNSNLSQAQLSFIMTVTKASTCCAKDGAECACGMYLCTTHQHPPSCNDEKKYLFPAETMQNSNHNLKNES